MSMSYDKKLVHDLCKDALSACNSVNINLIGLQSRLELGMPVDETAKVIDQDMKTLDDGIEEIGKAIMGGVVVE